MDVSARPGARYVLAQVAFHLSSKLDQAMLAGDRGAFGFEWHDYDDCLEDRIHVDRVMSSTGTVAENSLLTGRTSASSTIRATAAA